MKLRIFLILILPAVTTTAMNNEIAPRLGDDERIVAIRDNLVEGDLTLLQVALQHAKNSLDQIKEEHRTFLTAELSDEITDTTDPRFYLGSTLAQIIVNSLKHSISQDVDLIRLVIECISWGHLTRKAFSLKSDDLQESDQGEKSQNGPWHQYFKRQSEVADDILALILTHLALEGHFPTITSTDLSDAIKILWTADSSLWNSSLRKKTPLKSYLLARALSLVPPSARNSGPHTQLHEQLTPFFHRLPQKVTQALSLTRIHQIFLQQIKVPNVRELERLQSFHVFSSLDEFLVIREPIIQAQRDQRVTRFLNAAREKVQLEGLKFVIPNEHLPQLALPIWKNSAPGIYLSVGSDRSFLGAANSNATAMLAVDYDRGIVAYNLMIIELFKLANDGKDFLRLRTDFSFLSERIREAKASKSGNFDFEILETMQNSFAWEFLVNFSNCICNEEPHWMWRDDEHLEGVIYWKNEEHFLKLKNMAITNKMGAEWLDLRDEAALRNLSQRIRFAAQSISVIDFSNTHVHTFLGETGVGSVVDALEDNLIPSSMLLFTWFLKDETKKEYAGIFKKDFNHLLLESVHKDRNWMVSENSAPHINGCLKYSLF